MKIKLTSIYLIAISLVLGMTKVCAQDWPQFLGPNRNSTSPQQGILRTWPPNGPEVLWTVNVGPGFGGPVTKDGKLYLLDRDDKTGDIMRCFDLNNGKELWSYSYDSPGSIEYPGSRSVPAVDGKKVYSCGPYGDLYCIDINTHKPIWNKNIVKDFGGTKIPVWAVSQCPLIYKDMVIVSYSKDPKAGLVAYNKLNGNIIWKKDAIGNETYASPSIARIGGEDHIVMVFSSTNNYMHNDADITNGRIIGLKPKTGEILWEYNNWKNVIQIAPALDAGDGKIIVVGGYDSGTAMIRVEKMKDGKYNVRELYYHNDFGDHTKPPVLYNGYFYSQFSTELGAHGPCRWQTSSEGSKSVNVCQSC